MKVSRPLIKILATLFICGFTRGSSRKILVLTVFLIFLSGITAAQHNTDSIKLKLQNTKGDSFDRKQKQYRKNDQTAGWF